MSSYLFIDAGYIRRLFKDYIEPVYIGAAIDWQAIERHVMPTTGEGAAFRTFLYDCIEVEPRADETQEAFNTRMESIRAELRFVKSFPGYHIRLGDLVGSKKKTRRQKKVDVQLAVDMLSNAFSNNYDNAILVSGDLDFVPAVEEIFRLGKRVIVAAHSSSCAQELKDVADQFYPIDLYRFINFSNQAAYQAKVGVAEIDDEQWIRWDAFSYTAVVNGKFSIFKTQDGSHNWVAYETQNPGKYCWHPDRDLLVRFLNGTDEL
jgi:uncharacterized LabA/DUF88 family protein